MPDFLNVSEALNNLNLKRSYMAAEFGCGSADFAVALAKELNKGRVYALDVQEEKLSALRSKMDLQKLNNISTILCDLEAPNGSGLQSDSLDIVLIPNLLFQVEDKNAIIKEAKRVLKISGQLLVIDWSKSNVLGPKEGFLVSSDEVKKMATKTGFSLRKEFVLGDYHYALLFVK